MSIRPYLPFLAIFLPLLVTSATLSGAADVGFRRVDEQALAISAKVPGDAVFLVKGAVKGERVRGWEEEGVPRERMRVAVPTGEGSWTLELERFEIMTPQAVVVQGTSEGDVHRDMPKHALYRGRVVERANSRVFLADFDSYVTAMIEIDEPGGERRWMISPDTLMAGREAVMILHEVRAITGEPEACHSEELPDYQAQTDRIFKMLEGDPKRDQDVPRGQGSTVYTLHLALDCAYSYYLRHDTSFTYAAQYAITLAGACSAVYERDANVRLQVPFLRVWTVEDPFAASAIGDRLNKIRTGWDTSMKHVERSTVCYLSGQGGGGLAWVGVLCGGYGYNVSGVNGKVNFPAANYIWDVDVVSHELGHNIGSSHTHNCNWNPPIDSCWNAEGGCYDGTMPQRGTIMSYCHLTWKGTSLQFHPRVASLFNRVMERSACMSPVENGHDTDLAVVEILEPINGAVISPTRTFTPRVTVRNTGRTTIGSSIATYRVTNMTNDTLFTAQQTLPSLTPGAVRTASFPTIKVDQPGTYLLEAEISTANDAYATNNQLTRPFQIGPDPTASVKVVYPNGGEVLSGGEAATIRFNTSNVENVIITYSRDNGLHWETVKTVVKASDSSFKWTVPRIPTTTALVKITSLDNGRIYDVSDAVFTIGVSIDVGVVDITTPEANDTVTSPLDPVVVVRNNGSTTLDSARLRLTMRWVRRETPAYDTTITIGVMRAGESMNISMPKTSVLANGVHVVTATISAVGDQFVDNDIYARQFNAEGFSSPQSIRVEHGPKRVLLQWQAPEADSGRDIIEIWRGTSSATMERITGLKATVTSWMDLGLSDDVAYTYALRTRRDGGIFSPFSDLHVATPRTYPNGFWLNEPQLVSPPNGAERVPLPTDLVWSSVHGADRYEIQVSEDGQFSAFGPSISHVIITDKDGAIAAPWKFGQLRWWRVRAFNDSYTGAWSYPSSVFTATNSCAESAVRFNGVNAKATNDSFLWDGGPITVEFWQYVARADRANTTTFAIGEADDAKKRLQAHVPWGDGNIYFDYGSTTDSGRVVGSYNSAFDRWAHIALVSDGSTVMSIYIDGNLVAQRKGAMEVSGMKSITIGAMRSQHWFKGMIDDFRIWKTARTPEQIKASMGRVLSTSDRTGLYAYWSFDEGNGRNAADAGVSDRSLLLSDDVQWTSSGAVIACDAEGNLSAVSIPATTRPLTTTHTYVVDWPAVNGAAWYDVEIFDTDSDRGTPLHRIYNATQPRVEVAGLPAGTVIAYRVRARTSTARSPWSTGKLLVPAACESMVADFAADTSYFVSDSLWYRGRATTVEYWCYVKASDIGNRSAFSIGETDAAELRFQAHSPWSDKTLYWDHGNSREGGRVTYDMSNQFDRWTHIALASNGQDEMRIYVNGSLIATTDFASASGVIRKLGIGANIPSNYQFKGRMSDLRVWNIMRSAEQVREAMYERIVGGRSHLLGSWTLDDGRGLIAEDIAGGARDGVAAKTPNWQPDTGRAIMHVAPALRGPYVVTKGDTATYTLHTDLSSDVEWRAFDGIILNKPDPRTIVVQWVASASRGQLCVFRTFPSGCKDSACYDVLLQDPVGVDEEVLTRGEQIRLAPNPANASVRIITAADAVVENVEIYSILGARVAVIPAGATTGDVSHLATGAYIVRARVNGQLYSLPLTINH